MFTSELVEAAQSGDGKRVEALLQKGEDVNRAGMLGDTPLLRAARKARLNVLKLLLDRGANVKIADESGETCLGLAATTDSVECVVLLIEKGAELHRANERGDTPLHKAAKHGRLNVAALLLEKGLNVDQRNEEGETPLMHAACHDNLELVKLLLSRGADINALSESKRSCMYFAATGGCETVCKYLLEQKCVVFDIASVDGVTPLSQAAANGSEPVARALLEAKANVNAICLKGETPLLRAAMAGHSLVVETLIAFKVTVDQQVLGSSSTLAQVIKGAKTKRREIVFLLLAAGADPDQLCGVRSGTFLHEACRQCDVEVAALLLYFCANPNYLDEEGNPPLSHIPEDRKDFRDNFSAAACLRQTLSSGLDSRSSGHWPTFLTEGLYDPRLFFFIIGFAATNPDPDQPDLVPPMQACKIDITSSECAAPLTPNSCSKTSGHSTTPSTPTSESSATLPLTPSTGSVDLELLTEKLNELLKPTRGKRKSEELIKTVKELMEHFDPLSCNWHKYEMADEKKNYTRNLIATDNESFTLMLLVWNPHRASPIHDHAGSECWMRVVKGQGRECCYLMPSEEDKKKNLPLQFKSVKELREGQVAFIRDDIGLHRIENSGDSCMVSLHLYSPPFAECNIYLTPDCPKPCSSAVTFYSSYGCKSEMI